MFGIKSVCYVTHTQTYTPPHTHTHIYIEREINNYVCVCVQDWSEVGEFIYKKSTFSFQLRGLVADRFGHINHSTMMLQHIER